MLSKALLIRASDVESLDRLLDVLHASTLLLIELSPLFLESLGTGSPVSFKLLLMRLINPQFCKFNLALLVFNVQLHFLLLAFQLSFVLFYQSVLVFIEFYLTFFIKTVFFLS